LPKTRPGPKPISSPWKQRSDWKKKLEQHKLKEIISIQRALLSLGEQPSMNLKSKQKRLQRRRELARASVTVIMSLKGSIFAGVDFDGVGIRY